MKQLDNLFRDETITAFNNFVEAIFNKNVVDLKGFNVSPNDISYPKINVENYLDKIKITAEVPGYLKEDVKISFQNNLLVLQGKKRNNDEKIGDENFVIREIKNSSFKRSFSFNPRLYDTNKSTAKFSNGLLELVIPKIKKETEDSFEVKIS